MSLKSWFQKRQNGWFTLSAITAFPAFYFLFIHTGTVRGEKAPGLWITIGLVLAVAAIYFMYKASKTSTGGGGGSSSH